MSKSSISGSRYQVRIELKNVRPPVWRDVVVPSNISLPWLHEVIQEAMGWMDCHLHQFVHKGKRFVMDTEEDWDEGSLDEASVSLGQLLKNTGDGLLYEYDFGDGWEHTVTLKKHLPAEGEAALTCLKGKGACPPEDCGGPWGYMELRELASSAEAGERLSSEDRERLEWYEHQMCEDFEESDVNSINGTFAKMLSYVADGGGFEPGGASVPDGVFKPYELDEDDEDLEDLFGEMDEDGPEDAIMSMGDDEGEFPEPYSQLSADACAEFVAAMNCAAEVRKAEPWKQLHDCDVFGVEDPETGGIDIVSVLGAGEEVFSLHVHRAPQALLFWREALSNPGGMEPDWALHRSSILEVEFCNKGELEDPDVELYDRVGYEMPPRGRKRWFKFRTYRPRTHPWFPQAAELARWQRGARLCLRYLKLMAEAADGSRFLMEPDPSAGLPKTLKVFRLPEARDEVRDENWELSDVGIDWDSCEVPVEPFLPSEFELHQLANLPIQEGVWELGAIYLPSPVMTEEGPVLPVLAIALDTTMQIPPQPYVNADLEWVPTQVLWECLKERCLAAEAMPQEIHVSTDAASVTLQAFSKLTGVKVLRVESLPFLSGLFSSI